MHVYRTIDDLFQAGLLSLSSRGVVSAPSQVTERAKNAKAAAVIGGGLLGLEAAKARWQRGGCVLCVSRPALISAGSLRPETGRRTCWKWRLG